MRALVSVHDKSGLVDFVALLVGEGYEIVSSGGTADLLGAAGIPVTRVSEVTGAPEMLGGRVKTLHPKIHAGILARGEADDAELVGHGIARFDLVVCNLYPFRETLAAETDIDRIVEMIDIGGPAMVRAAAKNHRHVGVVVSPSQYEEVGAAVREGGLDQGFRHRLAAEAFFHTASYDAAIVGWMGDDRVLPLRASGVLRYGENPHQKAQIYREDGANPWWRKAVQHQGAEMSFNNYLDAEAAWRLANALGVDSAVVVKHTNPCGAALGATALAAFTAAWHGDPLAAFGGVVALGRELDAETAAEIAPKFVEIVIAPSVSREALEILEQKKRMRVLTAPAPKPGVDYRRLEAGFLAQEEDSSVSEGWEVVSDRAPTPEEADALRFAWTVAAHAKSNAIVLANGSVAVGVGAGDQSRVGAGERAVSKAGERSRGAVAASDAFFPFRDGIDVLADAGITAIIQPGGSRNDAEVIDAANQRGMAMVFTGTRHFRH